MKYIINGDKMIKKYSYYDADKEIAFVVLNEQEDVIQITHTFVNDAYRGKGLAKQLMDDVYLFFKNSNKKILPLCSYAISYFEKYQDKKDVL